jgi:hypothetical protein
MLNVVVLATDRRHYHEPCIRRWLGRSPQRISPALNTPMPEGALRPAPAFEATVRAYVDTLAPAERAEALEDYVEATVVAEAPDDFRAAIGRWLDEALTVDRANWEIVGSDARGYAYLACRDAGRCRRLDHLEACLDALATEDEPRRMAAGHDLPTLLAVDLSSLRDRRPAWCSGDTVVVAKRALSPANRAFLVTGWADHSVAARRALAVAAYAGRIGYWGGTIALGMTGVGVLLPLPRGVGFGRMRHNRAPALGQAGIRPWR